MLLLHAWQEGRRRADLQVAEASCLLHERGTHSCSPPCPLPSLLAGWLACRCWRIPQK